MINLLSESPLRSNSKYQVSKQFSNFSLLRSNWTIIMNYGSSAIPKRWKMFKAHVSIIQVFLNLHFQIQTKLQFCNAKRKLSKFHFLWCISHPDSQKRTSNCPRPFCCNTILGDASHLATVCLCYNRKHSVEINEKCFTRVCVYYYLKIQYQEKDSKMK